MSDYNYHIPKNPSTKFREAVRTWHLWYKEQFILPYFYSGKDFQNLKYLLRKLEQVQIPLQDFLDSIIDPWHLSNASIPLYNSHFNQLIKPPAPKPSRYPDHYNRKFERDLVGQEIIEYHKYLISIGYKKTYSPGSGTGWIKM